MNDGNVNVHFDDCFLDQTELKKKREKEENKYKK
jgi:hypothetical protein